MKIALLQLNYTVGDLKGNAQKIISAVQSLRDSNIDLCITSELSLQGYPPKDFLLNKQFIKQSLSEIENIANQLRNCPPTLIGVATPNLLEVGRPLHNSALLITKGTIAATFNKSLLPTYDVFDEDRYFEPATTSQIYTFAKFKIGVTICEDIWNDKELISANRYSVDPLKNFKDQGIDLLVNLSASPFTIGKQIHREEMLKGIAKKYNFYLAYVNQIGGNDDLVFAGRSCFFKKDGTLTARAKSFSEDIILIDTEKEITNIYTDDFTKEAESYKALVLGTRDYITKSGFSKAVLGLSGGIDSALTAAIAADAIGAKNVLGVLMPSPYSSQGSIDDALALARNLKIETITLPIKNIMTSFDTALKNSFAGLAPDTTEENIQSRIRGNLLMALSNKHRSILLTTGNKSELAVGYCTIYGDMSGGLAVIADVPKCLVYSIAKWLNKTKGNIIPENTINKPPSAELKPDQTDQDSLPDYEILDKILYNCIEQHKSATEIIALGFEEKTVAKILHLVKIAEFKRKQAAPGIKITDRAFGTGWRMPIAAKKDF